MGIKAPYYSRTFNQEVYHSAGKPQLPSESLEALQYKYKQLVTVFTQPLNDAICNLVFASACKDRIFLNRKKERT